MGHIFIIVLLVLIGVGFLIVVQISAAKRRQALSQWCRSRGLQFDPTPNCDFGDRYPDFSCLHQGNRRHAQNVMEGRIGKHQICAFDYHYETSNGKNSQSHDFSAIILTTNLPLKPLLIRHKGVFDRFASLLGFGDIEFESAAFSKEFHVASPDRRWAFDVLPQTTMEFLLDSPKFVLEFQLCQIIAYRNEIFLPADFDSAIAVIEGILSRLPSSLLQELQGVGE